MLTNQRARPWRWSGWSPLSCLGNCSRSDAGPSAQPGCKVTCNSRRVATSPSPGRLQVVFAVVAARTCCEKSWKSTMSFSERKRNFSVRSWALALVVPGNFAVADQRGEPQDTKKVKRAAPQGRRALSRCDCDWTGRHLTESFGSRRKFRVREVLVASCTRGRHQFCAGHGAVQCGAGRVVLHPFFNLVPFRLFHRRWAGGTCVS